MLLALLLLARVAADWVEITQEYRPPKTKNNPFLTPVTEEYFERNHFVNSNKEISKEYSDRNKTKSNPIHGQNSGFDRQPNPYLSVEEHDKPVRRNKTKENFRGENATEHIDKTKNKANPFLSRDVTTELYFTRSKSKPNPFLNRDIEKANILRSMPSFVTQDLSTELYLDKTKTKYNPFHIQSNYSTEQFFERSTMIPSTSTVRGPVRNRIYLNQTILDSHWAKGDVHRVPNAGIVKRVSTEKPSTSTIVLKTKPFESTIISGNQKYDYKTHEVFKSPGFVTKDHVLSNEDTKEIEVEIIDEQYVEDIVQVTRRPLKQTVTIIKQHYSNDDRKNVEPTDFGEDLKMQVGFSDRKVDKIVIKPDKNSVTTPSSFSAEKVIYTDTSSRKKQTSAGNTRNKESFEKTKQQEYNDKPSVDYKNIENFVKIMKVVADTISRNTQRSFKGKIRYLHSLKDDILATIAERIESTWPEDVTSPRGRHSRAAPATPRGHVEFPSAESALMTISFLTFAVYLIKLVLQVIQTYKNKTMMVSPAVVATFRRAASAFGNNHPYN